MSQLRHYSLVRKMEFVLIFDVPLDNRALARKTERDLNRVGARMLQQSVWKLEDRNELIDIAMLIKKSGGSARILEERFVF